MIDGQSILAIIPARSGSKGLPNKNILKLDGKPLIAWSIIEANKSKYIDKCIVSTNDRYIADISISYKCEVPFIRPCDLSTDKANLNDVIMHAIKTIDNQYDIVIVLQPTSPLRKSFDIDRALEIMMDRDAPTVVSVSQSNKPFHWNYVIEENGTLKPCTSIKNITTNRQQFPKTYLPNGALFISKVDYFIREISFYTNLTLAFVMPEERSIDIDSQIDFFTAQAIIDSKKN
tara:strand:+ start:354 stop:1049 length:696 start_codon:yes stop_codon:yes gene_type:complete